MSIKIVDDFSSIEDAVMHSGNDFTQTTFIKDTLIQDRGTAEMTIEWKRVPEFLLMANINATPEKLQEELGQIVKREEEELQVPVYFSLVIAREKGSEKNSIFFVRGICKPHTENIEAILLKNPAIPTVKTFFNKGYGDDLPDKLVALVSNVVYMNNRVSMILK